MFRISDTEWEALFNQPIELTRVYCVLRNVMNFDTGFAGKSPHRINDQFFKEQLGYTSVPGRKAFNPTRNQLRWWLKKLEDLGLIKHMGMYVFFLPLAELNNGNNGVGETSKKTNTTRSTTRGTTKGTTRGTTKKTWRETSKNKGLPSEVQPEAQPEVQPEVEPEVQPTSETTDITEVNNIYGQNHPLFKFNEFWKAYPKKVKKKSAQEIWIKDKLATKIDFILDDFKKRIWAKKKLHIPDPDKYLENQQWTDEFKGEVLELDAETKPILPSAEEAFAELDRKNPYPHPNSFSSDVISCIPSFRSLDWDVAKKIFIEVYNKRKDYWISRMGNRTSR